MPRPNHTRIMLCVVPAITLAACEPATVTTTQTANYDEPLTSSAECISTLEDGSLKWGGRAVSAEFVYQSADVEGDPEEFFFDIVGRPEGGYDKFINPQGGEQAIGEFLERKETKDTELLITDDLVLLRKRAGRKKFGDLIGESCGHLGNGVSLRQSRFKWEDN